MLEEYHILHPQALKAAGKDGVSVLGQRAKEDLYSCFSINLTSQSTTLTAELRRLSGYQPINRSDAEGSFQNLCWICLYVGDFRCLSFIQFAPIATLSKDDCESLFFYLSFS